MNSTNSAFRYSRQGFLGSHHILETTPIGVLGLGGGGSGVVTQLAFLGCCDVVGYDPNLFVEEKHLNRTLGLTVEDVRNRISKVQNANRIYKHLLPQAKPMFIQKRWQEEPAPLKRCKVIIGCLDNLREREMAEAFCRENGIHYIDIGLDVTKGADQYPRLAGQVIASAPGLPCLRCLGFITNDLLGVEAAEYGEAGPRAQVGFGNSVLVGAAISIATQILTGWSGLVRYPIYLQYDGNDNYMKPHPKLELLAKTECSHYPNALNAERRVSEVVSGELEVS